MTDTDLQPSSGLIRIDDNQRRRLVDLLQKDDAERALISEMLGTVRPADIADFLEAREFDEALALFRLLDTETAAEVLGEADDYFQEQLLDALSSPDLADLIDEMAPDDGVDILDLVEETRPHRVTEVIRELEQETVRELEPLRRYGSDTAGGIMTIGFVRIPLAATVNDALEAIRREAEEADNISVVFVVDNAGKLCGVMSVREIIVNPPGRHVSEFMVAGEAVITVPPDMDQQDVKHVMQKYDLAMVPVVDAENRLLGAVTFDDVLDVAGEEADEDLRLIAGMGEHDPVDGPIVRRVLTRLPWLMITLGGTFVSAAVLSAYQVTITKITAVMFFVPAVAAMAGNVGLQSSMTFVRALALGQVEFRMIGRLAFREIATGAVIGAFCGTLVGFGALVFGEESGAMLGLAVGVAMVLAICISSAIGTIVPLVMDRMKMDPALGAGPAITTLNDVISLSVYLGIATAMLIGFDSVAAAIPF